MQAHDDFWLKLHDLASDLDSDGMPAEEKAQVLAEYLVAYPPLAREQIEAEFRFLLTVLNALDKAVKNAPPSKPYSSHKGDGQ
jgi:hypothetical protein